MLRKKRAVSIIVCLVILLLPAVAYADTYKDETAQIEFTVPDGWTEKDLSEKRDIIKVKYVSDTESVYPETIMFGYSDLFGAMTEVERAGTTRAELNNSYFTVWDISDIFGADESQVQKVYYNGVEYFEYNLYQTEAYGATFDASSVNLVRFNNGYAYIFSYYYWMENKEHYNDFEDMIASVKYYADINQPSQTAMATANTSKPVSTLYAYKSLDSDSSLSDFSVPGLILSLILTILVYSLPIIIYRYVIKKRAMEKKKAKKVTVIYGIFSFIIMSIVLYLLGYGAVGSAIIFWSWVNYKMLTSGIMSMPKTEFRAINDYMRGMNADTYKDADISITVQGESGYSEPDTQGIHVLVCEPEAATLISEEAGVRDITSIDIGTKAGTDIISSEKRTAANITQDTQSYVSKTDGNVLEQIEQLNRLYEKGALTAEEFTAAKKRLIDKL